MITWSDVPKIITALGGAGVIAWFIINFLANILSKKLEAKIQSRYDQKLADIEAKHSKDLEELKAVFVKKNHVSKVRFEKEFEIYGQWSILFNKMIFNVLRLKPVFDILPADKNDRADEYKKRAKKVIKSYNRSLISLQNNAVFVPKVIYNEYDEIVKLCHEHYIDFDEWFNQEYIDGILPNEVEFDKKKYGKRSITIQNKRDEIINKLRSYLENLEVIQEN